MSKRFISLRAESFAYSIKSVSNPDFSLVVLCYGSGKSIIPFLERIYQTLSYLHRTCFQNVYSLFFRQMMGDIEFLTLNEFARSFWELDSDALLTDTGR